MDTCPQGAIDYESPGLINRKRCHRCGMCADVCPSGGLRRIGDFYSVEALAEILLRDLPFYRKSGGGITLSGGECALYPDYLELLLKRLKARRIHIALETSGYFDFDAFRRKILPYVDLIYYDLKIVNPEVHKRYVGETNRRILDYFCRILQQSSVEVHPRIPLIPNITTTQENISAAISLLCEAGAKCVSLLPYNPMGIETAISLGKSEPPLPKSFMKPSEEREIHSMFEKMIEERGMGGIL
jgi:pyruvate formate lyase activating enzyme